MVTAPATGNEVGKNAHHNDRRHPDQGAASKQEAGKPGAGTVLSSDHGDLIGGCGFLWAGIFREVKGGLMLGRTGTGRCALMDGLD
jgi:hypothetical protein